MKAYILIPLYSSKEVKIKERDYYIIRSTLTPDYAKCFGTKNEYYIDFTAKDYRISGQKYAKYDSDRGTWYYSALKPHDVIKKKVIKG